MILLFFPANLPVCEEGNNPTQCGGRHTSLSSSSPATSSQTGIWEDSWGQLCRFSCLKDLLFSGTYIGIDFGGVARAHAPNNWEMPMHLSVFTAFCPPKFGFAPPIFLTSLRQCVHIQLILFYLCVCNWRYFFFCRVVLLRLVVEWHL